MLRPDHPARIAARYLRETVARPRPAGLTPFLTAFDIAAAEAEAGRLTASDAIRVGDAVLAGEAQEVNPEYAQCPASPPPCRQSPVELHRQCERVRQRVGTICSQRRS